MRAPVSPAPRPPGSIRTMLFVPGDRPDRIGKALTSHADCVVIDLEDAVAVSAKHRAREGAVTAIQERPAVPRPILSVRVNALASGLLEADLAALRPVWQALEFIVLPMVPDATTVHQVSGLLADADGDAGGADRGPLLIPLIETAAGVLGAAAIAAAHRRVHTLTFGPGDLSRQLGLTPTPDGVEMLHARSQVVLAAAAAGLSAPIDGPWLNVADSEGLRRSSQQARLLGFAGKQVIHPGQLPIVAETFAPSEQDIAWARQVDHAFAEAEQRGTASIRLSDGTFVDYAVALRARALLERER